jgi:hypothetical protein
LNQAIRAILNSHSSQIEDIQKSLGDAATVGHAAPTTYRDGIPASVYNDIVAASKHEYPEDYNMQLYYINEQVDAYRKLHP